MGINKSIFSCAAIFLLTACASPNGFHRDVTHIPSLDDQCKILNKKREVKLKRGSSDSKKIRKNQRSEYPTKTVVVDPKKEIRHALPVAFLIDSSDVQPAVFNTVESSEQNVVVVSRASHQARSQSPNIIPTDKSTSLQPLHSVESNFVDQQRLENNLLPGLVGLSGILSMILLGTFRKNSKQISYWAAKNPWKARGLLTATHVATSVSAIALGDQLFADGLLISDTARYIAGTSIAAAVCLYPIHVQTDYLRRKILDVTLFTSGVVMFMYAGNHYEITQQQNSVQPIYSFASTSTMGSWHVVKKEASIIKKKAEDEPKKKSSGEKAALTFLALLAFIALGYAIGALACSLSCSGHETLAGIVGIGGLVGLFVGFVAILRVIFGKKSKKKKLDKEPQAMVL